jgi:hypothetical protein
MITKAILLDFCIVMNGKIESLNFDRNCYFLARVQENLGTK